MLNALHHVPYFHPHRDEVKAAFRRAARVCHPDIDKSPQAAARFTQVKLAADVLLKGVRAAGMFACFLACWMGKKDGTAAAVCGLHCHMLHLVAGWCAPACSLFGLAMLAEELLALCRWFTLVPCLSWPPPELQHTVQPGMSGGWTAAAAAATGQSARATGVPRNRTAALWAGLLVACGLAFGYG